MEVRRVETTELAKLIKSRRSVRIWQDKKVPEELLLQAMELATWAPNGGNRQPWFFYIVVNKDVINSIADATLATAKYVASWPESKALGEMAPLMAQRAGAFRTAPAIIAAAVKKYQSPMDQVFAAREKVDVRASQIRKGEQIVNSRIQTVSAAVSYLVLVLHQMGLGAVWMTGPLQAKAEIEQVLKVPADMDIVALVPIGYPAETPTRDRKPVSEVSRIIR
jgi:nitroreductase